MISNYPFVSCKRYSMVYKKHFIQYRYDTNLLYPTSYVYDPSYTKTKSKVENLTLDYELRVLGML